MEEFNFNWEFYSYDITLNSRKDDFIIVNLPHTNKELPINYFNEKEYQFVSSYRKVLNIKKENRKCYVLDFEGIMSLGKLYIQGNFISSWNHGYTDFKVDVTNYLVDGENEIIIVVDSSEKNNVPPFGGLIDYMTFGGIYREAHFFVKNSTYIEYVFGFYEDDDSFLLKVGIFGDKPQNIDIVISDENIKKIFSFAYSSSGKYIIKDTSFVHLWNPEDPYLYNIEVSIPSDDYIFKYGFRHLKLINNLLAVNGKTVKLIGLNRHQSFPYIGYAGTKNMQKIDADILYDLGINCIRTSHYPQSRHFLDECDKKGLLVMEEIPGWQHLGDNEWKKEALKYVKEMIQRDLNHPSIFLWGVRVNESEDEHDLYKKTNALAHELDPLRFTGGVRCKYESEFLEDVYTFNDFSYSDERPLDSITKSTGLKKPIPYLISEFGGHIYPTDKLNNEERLVHQLLIHSRIQHSAYINPNIMGAIGWCAFDYNTHSQFGSGDRICRHGVMDIFRLPKLASLFYKGQKPRERGLFLEAATEWAFGEKNYGGIIPLYIFTNCDSVIVRIKNQKDIILNEPDEEFKGLINPIFRLDSMSGIWGQAWEDGTLIGLIDGKEVIRKDYVASQIPTSLKVKFSDSIISYDDAIRVEVALVDQVGNKLKYSSDVLKIFAPGQEIIGPDFVSLYGGEYAFYIRGKTLGRTIISFKCRGFLNQTVLEVK